MGSGAFHGHHHGGLAGAGPRTTVADPVDERLVDLDGHVGATEAVAVGADHGPAQLVQPRPRRLVGAEPQVLLQARRRDAVPGRGDQPHRGQPRRQRRPRPVEDRARGHRGLPTAGGAHPSPGTGPPRLRLPTARADEALRPSQSRQVVQARVLVREPLPHLGQRPRVVDPAHRMSHRIHPTTLLKQIRRTYVRTVPP